MKGYKAFYRYEDKLRCRDKVYEVGKTYTENEAVLCKSGMHFCSLLIDTLIYYNAAHAVICEVEAPDKLVKYDANSCITKYCTTELRIIREVPIDECRDIAGKEIDENYVSATLLGIDLCSAFKFNSLRRKAFEELSIEATFRVDDTFFREEIESHDAFFREETESHEGL